MVLKAVSGGLLVQDADTKQISESDLKVVTERQPTPEEMRALKFAWIVCKHVKSNAIVYARDGQTVGVGAGQMSRVDSCKIGAMKAVLPLKERWWRPTPSSRSPTVLRKSRATGQPPSFNRADLCEIRKSSTPRIALDWPWF